MEFKIILTGATGMVGEGVLFECLHHPEIKEILMVNRKHYDLDHPKLKECIVPDFLNLEKFAENLSGYDACFYCAGISSRGMKEAEYSFITYDTTLQFAKTLLRLNPGMIFNYVSGGNTDSSEMGSIMWARVKGRTENGLMKLSFKSVYNFRPGFMKPVEGQKNIKGYYKTISKLYPILKTLFPRYGTTLEKVGLAMIHSLSKGYSKQILENKDIELLAEI